MKYLAGLTVLIMVLWAFGVELTSASLPDPLIGNSEHDRNCEDLLLVFARASGHNRVGYDANPYDGILGEIEAESHRYFTEIERQLNANGFGNLSVDRVSLHNFRGKYSSVGYPAVKVFNILNADETINGIEAQFNYNNSDYKNSVDSGVIELKGFLEDQLIKCPNQLVLVGGFSQGAQVVGQTMWALEASGLGHILNRIERVDVFGDPKFYGVQKTGLFSGNKLSYARGDVKPGQSSTLGPRIPYFPASIVNKSTSWCHHLDAICSGFFSTTGFGLLNTHSHIYDDVYIESAAKEIYVSIAQKLSDLTGAGVAERRSNKAVWPDGSDDQVLDLMILLDTTNNSTNLQYKSLYSAVEAQSKKLIEAYPSVNIGLAIYGETVSGGIEKGNYAVKLPLGKHIDYNSNGELRFDGLSTELGKLGFYKQTSGENGRFEDNILHSIKGVIETTDWRPNSKKVVMYYSNGGLKLIESDGTSVESVVALAKQKEIDILPVFNSTNSYNDQVLKSMQDTARISHQYLGSKAGTYVTEFSDYVLRPHELRDVLVGYHRKPVGQIELAGGYDVGPSVNQELDGKLFVVGQEVRLSASSSYDPDSYITNISWDINNDGDVDYSGDTISHTYNQFYSGPITVILESADGGVLEHEQQIIVGSRNDDSISDLPSPTTPTITQPEDSSDSGHTLILNDVDDLSEAVIIVGDGELIAITNPNSGHIVLNESQLPDDRLVEVSTSGPNGVSEVVELVINSVAPEIENGAEQAGNGQSSEVSGADIEFDDHMVVASPLSEIVASQAALNTGDKATTLREATSGLADTGFNEVSRVIQLVMGVAGLIIVAGAVIDLVVNRSKG